MGTFTFDNTAVLLLIVAFWMQDLFCYIILLVLYCVIAN